ncbi:MAG: chaperone modulator CbpM [Prevotellaceae bacterium]|jgi:hypothetical protein|nr:chaperone modulator CbpM [Prevotellaceae bacterium]
MQADLIIISEYSRKSNIDPVFLLELDAENLIDIQIVDNEKYISVEQLPDLEKYIRWHYDLSLNVEGIDVVRNLLERIDTMQNEINELRNKLHIYGQ